MQSVKQTLRAAQMQKNTCFEGKPIIWECTEVCRRCGTLGKKMSPTALHFSGDGVPPSTFLGGGLGLEKNKKMEVQNSFNFLSKALAEI